MVHRGVRPLNGNLRQILMLSKEFHSELDPEPDQNRIQNTSKKRPRATSGANMAPTWRTEHKDLSPFGPQDPPKVLPVSICSRI